MFDLPGPQAEYFGQSAASGLFVLANGQGDWVCGIDGLGDVHYLVVECLQIEIGIGRQQKVVRDCGGQCAADNAANGKGILGGRQGKDCVAACAEFRPAGMTFP